ncbi:hypothetical protein FDUTEX481_02420 [Tolypothrix sp. PCC 7601]|nr:hypothetical protein FDUTEX481_02420 [Tolypothrix sp. PCC 7601]
MVCLVFGVTRPRQAMLSFMLQYRVSLISTELTICRKKRSFFANSQHLVSLKPIKFNMSKVLAI